MSLWIEKYFGVHHALAVSLAQVGLCQCVEVIRVAKHIRAGVVNVEEGLQIRELVGTAQILNRRIGQRNAVLFRELKRHFRLERAFDMQMQLRLG